MRHSSRFWFFMLGLVFLQLIFAEGQKLNTFSNGASSLRIIRKRSAEKTSIKQLASMAISVIAIGANPLFAPIGIFMFMSMTELMWPTDSRDPTGSTFTYAIRAEMNRQSVGRMKMKLRDYKRKLKNLLHLVNMPPELLHIDPRNCFNVNDIKDELEKYNFTNPNSGYGYALFKHKIHAITEDVRSDRDVFYLPNDPATSMAYYLEYANLEMALLSIELLIHAGDLAPDNVLTFDKNRIKYSAETHFRFVQWAAYKSASVIEAKDRCMYRYSKTVDSILEKFPLQKWLNISGFRDDSKYIRNTDHASFKDVDINNSFGNFGQWLSCWSSGSECAIRTCPGVDDPFGAGNENEFRCRGEVFQIFGDGRYKHDYIRVCDKVALRYDVKYNKGYWLSYDNGWLFKPHHYRTRTCPGLNFFFSNLYTCSAEIFILEVHGRSCGERLQDRDFVRFRRHDYLYVTTWGGSYLTPNSSPHMWRIFKYASFLREP